MHDEINFKISQLIDNELEKEEALKLFKLMDEHPEIADKMRCYDVVSQAIKTEVFLPVSTGFVSRVNQQIKQEPVYLVPAGKRSKRRYMKLTAVAASVAATAILVTQGMYDPFGNDKSTLFVTEIQGVHKIVAEKAPPLSKDKGFRGHQSALMVAGKNSGQDVQINPQSADTGLYDRQVALAAANGNTARKINPDYDVDLQRVDSRFNDYLHAHSGNMFSSGTNYQAFAEVANFEQ